jgi:hypothetical protein
VLKTDSLIDRICSDGDFIAKSDVISSIFGDPVEISIIKTWITSVYCIQIDIF